MDETIPQESNVNVSTRSRMTREVALERVRALLPAIRGRAAETESRRMVSPDSLKDLHDAGLMDLARPALFGGAELGMADLVAVAVEIASACASTSWVYCVFVGHDWMSALFPEEAQREVFDTAGGYISSVVHFGGNLPTRVPGGFRFKYGSGRLCSGVDHAAWVLLGTSVAPEGDEQPEPRYFLVPKSEFEVIDDWHTTGLRGTGSKSIRLADAFVPEYRTVSISDLARGMAPGLALHKSDTYRAPFPEVLILALIGTPLGIGRGALEAYADSLRAQFKNLTEDQISEQSASFTRLAQSSAEIEAVTSVIMAAADRIDASYDPSDFTRVERARLLRDYAFSAQSIRAAVNRLFDGGGSRAVFDSSDLQRMWRDVNTACAHAGFSWDRTISTFARAYLDLPPGRFEARRGH